MGGLLAQIIMKAFLLDIDYETQDNRAVIRLFLKDEDGRFFLAKDRNFSPYFYAFISGYPNEIIQSIKELDEKARIKKLEIVEKKYFKEIINVLRITVGHPQDVVAVREKINELEGIDEIHEYDILFARRYLIDKNITPMDWLEIEGKKRDEYLEVDMIKRAQGEVPELKVLSFDIEVYNPKGVPRSDRDPIIMVSLASSKGLKKVLTWKDEFEDLDFVEVLPDETSVLKRFEDIVFEEDFDIVIGYNTDNFDFPYIEKRLKALDISFSIARDGSGLKLSGRKNLPEAKIKGRPHADVYSIVKKNVKLSSYVLENVVGEVLGIQKEKIPGKKLYQYWDEGGESLRKLAKYSLEDAEVTLKLGQKFLPLYEQLAKIIGQTLHDVTRMTTGQLVEWLLMRESSLKGNIIPNRPHGSEYMARAGETYTGGYVKSPKRGLSENIAVFDFRSLYPSVIVTHNIDLSTLKMENCKENIVPEFGYCFETSSRGFIPEILKDLVGKRNILKKKLKENNDPVERLFLHVQQHALKILANSFYGYMGYPRARWYKRECAQAVASLARMYIKKVMTIAEEDFSLEVIYGDTDSLFVIVPENKRNVAIEFLKKVNADLPGIIELEYEGYYKRGLFVTKKRYALIDENGKITVKGLEFVRRDWAAIARKTQEKVLKILLKDANPEKAAKLVREVIINIKERRVKLEDLIIYTQLTKSIKSYKNIEPHLIAAKRLKDGGEEVVPGMIIGYVIVKGTNKLISMRAEPAAFVKLENYDPDYYIDNQILPAVLRIFEAIGYTRDYLREGIEQRSLKGWF